MKHKLLAAVLPATIALASTSAKAEVLAYSGAGCQPTAAAQSCVDRTQYGTHNTCSFDIVLECPIDISFKSGTSLANVTGTVTTFAMQAYDRSASADVSCDLQRV